MQLLRPLLGATDSETPEVALPAICFTHPPGDPCLQMTALVDLCGGHHEERLTSSPLQGAPPQDCPALSALAGVA